MTETTSKVCTGCGIEKSLDEFAPEKRRKSGKGPRCFDCKRADNQAYYAQNIDHLTAYNAERKLHHVEPPDHKTCRKCGEAKLIKEFGVDAGTKDGKATRCKECKREEAADYRSENAEKCRASTAAWKHDHPDDYQASIENSRPKKNKRRRERHVENKEKENAQNAAWYEANKADRKISMAAWEKANQLKRKRQKALQYLENQDTILARNAAWDKAHPESGRVRYNRRRARLANAAVNDLSPAQWKEVLEHFQYRCVYCPPTCKACKERTHVLTQDHITPIAKKGSHTLWNVVPACLEHNSAKYVGDPLQPVQPLLLTVADAKKPQKSEGAELTQPVPSANNGASVISKLALPESTPATGA